jgi:hypothetical protein
MEVQGATRETNGVLGRALRSMNEILGQRLSREVRARQEHLIAPEVVDPLELLLDLRALFAPRAAAEGIALTVERAERLPQVAADLPARAASLSSLLAGAFRRTAPGGRIVLAARLAERDVRLEIWPSGRRRTAAPPTRASASRGHRPRPRRRDGHRGERLRVAHLGRSRPTDLESLRADLASGLGRKLLAFALAGVLVEPVVERAQADPEDVRGGLLVPALVRQRGLDQALLGLRHRGPTLSLMAPSSSMAAAACWVGAWIVYGRCSARISSSAST